MDPRMFPSDRVGALEECFGVYRETVSDKFEGHMC